ncbi:MAG: Gldg family protein [Myxococcota bacterium]
MATTRKNAAAESFGFLALIAGILIVLNFLAFNFSFGRLDVTEARLWSLSEGSKSVVRDLGDRLEVVAFFTEKAPAPWNSQRQVVRDLLEEYRTAAGGNLSIRFVDPDDDEKKEEAEEAGVPAHPVPDYETGGATPIYHGLVFRYLGEEKVFPLLQSTDGLEYQFTMAIKELAGDKTPIGLVTGHGSPSLTEGMTALRELLPTYELKEVDLATTVDPDLRALLIVEPTEAFEEPELRRIDEFVMNGGGLGVFGGAWSVTLEGGPPSASAVETGLNRVLGRYGVELQPGLVMDQQAGRAPMRGPLGLQMLVLFPPVPVISFTDAQQDHPVLFQIPSAPMPFTASLGLTSAPEGVNVTTLGQSSEYSWRLEETTLNLQPKDPREWRQTGDVGPHTVLAAIEADEGKLPSAFASNVSGEGEEGPSGASENTAPSRVLVGGTGSFFRDQFMPPPGPNGDRQLGGTLAFALNSIDWLAADSDLIAIRAKTVEDPPLEIPDEVELAETEAIEAAENQDVEALEAALDERKEAIKAWDAKKDLYKWLNTLGIPAAFGLFGFLRWRFRQSKRQSMTL